MYRIDVQYHTNVPWATLLSVYLLSFCSSCITYVFRWRIYERRINEVAITPTILEAGSCWPLMLESLSNLG